MAEALRHRGPDGEAVEPFGPATLVCTRLAIIDVAGGDQPLLSEDGELALVANGEIYNHQGLRGELTERGHRFASGSDCEVLVHAYEEHGLDFVRRLNGMYGLALWDMRHDRLVAARDPFGVKPLYWWSDGRRTAVASEVGALVEAGLVKPELDPIALDHYLACRFVPGSRTLFKGVSKLAPGDVLTATPQGDTRITSFREAPGEELDEEDGLAAELAERFEDAVERQMMSDVPYGAFLSGGVDSAAIVAAMAARSQPSPNTFTVGFPGAGEVLDEREAAAHSARMLGSAHHDTAMVEGDYLSELGQAVRRLEEPCGIPSAPALLQLSRFAARDVKVVLSGQGADEPHGGYGRHQAAALLGPLSRLPGSLARLAASLPNERARRLGHLLGPMDDARRLVRLVEISDSGLRHKLTGHVGGEAERERTAQAADLLRDVDDRNLLGQALYLDTRMFLPASLLICGDKMSMAASLEQRVPFLDVELMRFVERVPARARVRLRAGKRLHRRAMERLLPPEIARRPKHGFASPWDHWLKDSLGREIEQRYAPGSELSQLIDPAAATQLVQAHRSGRADHRWVLFCLLELSEWHEAFVAS